MTADTDLFARLTNEFGQHPVVSNVFFGFLLAGVEKMLEVEFACPCNPMWNAIFVSPFFLIPAITSSLLMLLIHGYAGYKNILCCCLPPVVWLALMLLDGQYMVCAKTDWQGTFVTAQETYLKWCEPTNTTVYSADELLHRSHRFYILSQGFGNAIITFLLIVLVVYIICTRGSRQKAEITKQGCQTGEDAPDAQSIPLQGASE